MIAPAGTPFTHTHTHIPFCCRRRAPAGGPAAAGGGVRVSQPGPHPPGVVPPVGHRVAAPRLGGVPHRWAGRAHRGPGGGSGGWGAGQPGSGAGTRRVWRATPPNKNGLPARISLFLAGWRAAGAMHLTHIAQGAARPRRPPARVLQTPTWRCTLWTRCASWRPSCWTGPSWRASRTRGRRCAPLRRC
jgi:hypothetical protein